MGLTSQHKLNKCLWHQTALDYDKGWLQICVTALVSKMQLQSLDCSIIQLSFWLLGVPGATLGFAQRTDGSVSMYLLVTGQTCLQTKLIHIVTHMLYLQVEYVCKHFFSCFKVQRQKNTSFSI
jgi:hypothetical protein